MLPNSPCRRCGKGKPLVIGRKWFAGRFSLMNRFILFLENTLSFCLHHTKKDWLMPSILRNAHQFSKTTSGEGKPQQSIRVLHRIDGSLHTMPTLLLLWVLSCCRGGDLYNLGPVGWGQTRQRGLPTEKLHRENHSSSGPAHRDSCCVGMGLSAGCSHCWQP